MGGRESKEGEATLPVSCTPEMEKKRNAGDSEHSTKGSSCQNKEQLHTTTLGELKKESKAK